MKALSPALALLLLAFGLNAAAAEKPEKLRVFVPILPYEYLLERIGGDWIEVKAIVQKGDDAHNYSPSPRQITEISKANLIFSGGISFEANFFVALGDGIHSPKDIDLLEGLELLADSCSECEVDHDHDHEHAEEKGDAAEKDDHEHDHDHDDLRDPHVWLSPKMLLHQAGRIAAILKAHTPAEASPEIDANLAALESDLKQLDRDLTETLAPVKNSTIYVYHGAFAYFAADYGLTQKSIELAGRSPSPRQVAEVAKRAKAEGVKVIFVQPQFDQSSAESLAETIGGKVQTLDPLEKDIMANLRLIAKTIRSAR
ncbi:MAG: zinc ABC transporter solute-binding protein [Verrucomicrobiaceae bacterium]|nr:zinc ABC transporter solute-binding protein [Verrucomicrobiaceae bacterium]